MNEPRLRNWRLISEVLVGEVKGHPNIAPGWMVTSRVTEIADDRSWAKTKSRLYLLEAPFPDNGTMPGGAEDALMARIFSNVGTIPAEQLERYVSLVKQLLGPRA